MCRVEIGRYVVSFRFGRYRTGYRRITPRMWDAALPFMVVSVIHRQRAGGR